LTRPPYGRRLIDCSSPVAGRSRRRFLAASQLADLPIDQRTVDRERLLARPAPPTTDAKLMS
jgi:hypothetical protein